jgi:hypothetical protein
MSRPQPASPGRQLPRGHLLVLNQVIDRFKQRLFGGNL